MKGTTPPARTERCVGEPIQVDSLSGGELTDEARSARTIDLRRGRSVALRRSRPNLPYGPHAELLQTLHRRRPPVER
jgi:hypothetical protein